MNVHKGGEGHCKMKSAAPIFLLHPTKEESKDSSLGIGVRYNQGVWSL